MARPLRSRLMAWRLALTLAFATFPAHAETTSETEELRGAIATLQRAEATLGKDRAETLAAADALAKIHYARSNFREAESLYRRVAEGRERLLGIEHPDTIAALNQLGGVLFKYGKAKEAESLLRRALDTSTRVLGADHAETIRSLNNYSFSLIIQGRYAEAEPPLRQALATYERVRGKEHPSTLNAVHGLAVLSIYQARYEEAETLFRRAFETSERTLGAEDPRTLGYMSSLANFSSEHGRLGEAEQLYRRAAEAQERTLGSEHPDTLVSLGNLATAYHGQGRYTEAEALYKRVLEASARILGEDHPITLSLLGSSAGNYEKQGRIEEAVNIRQRALAAKERVLGVEHPDTLVEINDLAVLFSENGRLEEAEPLLKRALETGTRTLGVDHPTTLKSMYRLGDLYRLTGRGEEAEPLLLRSAFGVARIRKQGAPNYLNYPYLGLARLLANHHRNPDKAIFFYKQAINLLQDQRQTIGLDSNRTALKAFLSDHLAAYTELQRLLIARGRFGEAEQVGRMVKNDEFRFYSVRSATELRGDSLALNRHDRDWQQQFADWNEPPTRLAADLDTRRAGQPAPESSAAIGSVQLGDLESSFAAVYDLYSRNVGAWMRATGATGAGQTRAEARRFERAGAERRRAEVAAIGPDVALVQIVAFEDSLQIFLTTPRSFKSVEVPVARADLFAAIFEARNEIDVTRTQPLRAEDEQHRAALEEKLGRLHDWLIAPIAAHLARAGTRTLMLNLQGQIRYVPFAALWDGKNWLTEHYQLALATPAANTHYVRPVDIGRGTAFGLSQAVPGFAALVGVQDELEGIMGGAGRVGILKGPPIALDTAFNQQALEDALANPTPILHIASHFKVAPGDETGSFLVLGDGTRLSLAEVSRSSRLRFKGVELLTLSACETALGGEASGMEIEGLGVLAQSKGAASVIASLWQVSDDSTPAFMQSFYAALVNQGLTKAQAMQSAQVAMIGSELDSDPFYWAPFILMGNWM